MPGRLKALIVEAHVADEKVRTVVERSKKCYVDMAGFVYLVNFKFFKDKVVVARGEGVGQLAAKDAGINATYAPQESALIAAADSKFNDKFKKAAESIQEAARRKRKDMDVMLGFGYIYIILC